MNYSVFAVRLEWNQGAKSKWCGWLKLKSGSDRAYHRDWHIFKITTCLWKGTSTDAKQIPYLWRDSLQLYNFCVFPDLWLSGDCTQRCQYTNYFNTMRACSHSVSSYCQISSIWKLIQHCFYPFYSVAVLQDSCQRCLITLFHLTPQVSKEAVRTALHVARSISPGNFLCLYHQCIIMSSTAPPQSHVDSLTYTLKVTLHTWPPQAALSHLSENHNCVTCLRHRLPVTFYHSLSLPQSSRMQIVSDRAIVNSITER